MTEAKVYGSDESQLTKLLNQAESLSPNRSALAATGIGILLGDQTVWSETQWPKAQRALESWKKVKGMATKDELLKNCDRLFRGLKANAYLRITAELMSELRTADDKPRLSINYKMAAVALVDAGFQHFRSLAFADSGRLSAFSSNLATKGLIVELVDKATYEAKVRRKVREIEIVATAKMLASSKGRLEDLDAKRLADSLDSEKVATKWMQSQEEGVNLGVPNFATKPRPRRVVEALKEATKTNEKAVHGYLRNQATQLQLYTNRKSLKYVRAGLRCWHFFATGVLGYQTQSTLPPKDAYDIVRYVSIFHNGGTAANYVGYIKFGCYLKGLPTGWFDKQVSVALKGLSKAALDHFGGPQRCKFLLTTGLTYALVASFDIHDHSFSTAILGNWENLLRVKSEGLALFMGEAQDQTVRPNRPNGVHIDKKGQANLWLKKRKHRPAGSLLTRSCSCRMTTTRFCWACNVKKMMIGKMPGDVLWCYSPNDFMEKVKDALKKLKQEEASKLVSFKSWRAGKATECLKMNMPVAEIFGLGEWKSEKAAIRYADEDMIDPVRLMWQVIDGSESEGEAEAAPKEKLTGKLYTKHIEKKDECTRKRKAMRACYWTLKRSTATMGV